MKLRVLNIIYGVLFFISSSSLLIIPFLDFDDNLSISAYAVALLFWGGSISGIIIQIILFVTCKKYTKVKKSKTRQIVGVIFLISVFVLIPIMAFWRDNEFALSINLFLLLFSIEIYFVIKRMECLKWEKNFCLFLLQCF